jgi:hypothetical protein
MPAWRSVSTRRRPPARGRRAGALGLILVALAAGCILQPREAEDPNSNSGPVWVQPVYLGNALGNMERSLESKVLTNYGRSFSSVIFVLELDPTDLADLGENRFDPWSAAQEEQLMTGILNQTPATLSVTWTVGDSLEESSSVRYYRDLRYRLTFFQAGISVVYSGLVDLYFTDDGTGSWYVTRWVDKRDGSANPTWGWLRGRNQVEFPAP